MTQVLTRLVVIMKALVIGVGFFAVLLGFLSVYCRGLLSTRYARGYSETAFQRVQVGDGTNTVIGILGNPLNMWTNHPLVVWEYTECAGLGGFWLGRKIVLSNDAVVWKISGVMD
jgi:hypothetical protein